MGNVLITGSSSGLGLALAKAFKEMGYTVYGLSRSETKLEINQESCDFSTPSSITQYLERLIDVKDFDYVFLNAGMLGKLAKTSELTVKEYEQIFNVNVFSNKIILDYLMENCKVKNVIGISSGAALKTYLGWSLYCTSKAAFKQLVSSYSDEYKDTMFLNLAPGLIKSKMQDKIKSISVDEIPSLQKFHDAYDTMDTPEIVAGKIINKLNRQHITSGGYLDIRDI